MIWHPRVWQLIKTVYIMHVLCILQENGGNLSPTFCTYGIEYMCLNGHHACHSLTESVRLPAGYRSGRLGPDDATAS